MYTCALTQLPYKTTLNSEKSSQYSCITTGHSAKRLNTSATRQNKQLRLSSSITTITLLAKHVVNESQFQLLCAADEFLGLTLLNHNDKIMLTPTVLQLQRNSIRRVHKILCSICKVK